MLLLVDQPKKFQVCFNIVLTNLRFHKIIFVIPSKFGHIVIGSSLIRFMKIHVTLLFFLAIGLHLNAQKITVIGKVVEAESTNSLEFATVILAPTNGGSVEGGVTDSEGNFSIDVKRGSYSITVEFLSFESLTLNEKNLRDDTNLGIIKLSPSAEALDEVEIIAEKSTVEIKLDKKIYNVGKDMTVKGGNAVDVLDNVPSVTVDVEGAVSLRGNESVRILINGKPSALVGLGNDALKQLPAEAIEKVEVITSPSARYDAEGTAGIINIVLRKGKALGFNGTANAYIGTPETYGVSGNLNLRTEKVNFFTNLGGSYSDAPGNGYFETVDTQNVENYYSIEDRTYDRLRKGFNVQFGLEYYLSKKSSITGSIFYNYSDRETDAKAENTSLTEDLIETEFGYRNELEDELDKQVEFNLNFSQSFDEDDHKLTFDFRHEATKDDELADIIDATLLPNPELEREKTSNFEERLRLLFQSDYINPISENSQFEAGFRSTINNSETDFTLEQENDDGDFEVNTDLSNIFIYDENVNALYAQYGTKWNQLSGLFGLRMENTNIDIEVQSESTAPGANTKDQKNYTDFFPTVNLAYELSDESSLTLGYNRRIRRPRGRFLNPFPSRVSETNIFKGNPDLDPSISDGFDLGYLKKWPKFMFNTSIYYNYATDVFDFIVVYENGVAITTPRNIASEQRLGWEFSFNYSPFKIWRLTSSLNFYRSKRDGNGEVPNFENDSWFGRLNSRLQLPGKIDWQTTFDYRAPSENFQTRRDARYAINLAFSKDILKENATLSLNVSDLLNSRKRISTTTFDEFSYRYSEFQWRERQIRLNFTYRFNQKKKRGRSQQGRFEDDAGEVF